MRVRSARLNHVLENPGAFTWGVLKAFRRNQGLLLAGAVAYYALLSVVPLLILAVFVLSYFIDRGELLAAIGMYFEWLVPGQSGAIVGELRHFLDKQAFVGPILLVTLVFFSSLAFTVLESAMAVIFLHRFSVKKRRYVVSAVLPYIYILCLGVGLLVVTVAFNAFQSLGDESVSAAGREWSLQRVSVVLLYLLGFVGEVFLVGSVYMVMPVGRLPWRHALLGGAVAALLWELVRHVLAWYFGSLSQVSVVYGSLTTAIVVLFSLEIGATLLLLGAQVISEYERIGLPEAPEPRVTG